MLIDLFECNTGDVTVAALLDLTQGLQCNQSNPASRQSMNGMLQTFQTLNSIQYLNGAKLGAFQVTIFTLSISIILNTQ